MGCFHSTSNPVSEKMSSGGNNTNCTNCKDCTAFLPPASFLTSFRLTTDVGFQATRVPTAKTARGVIRATLVRRVSSATHVRTATTAIIATAAPIAMGVWIATRVRIAQIAWDAGIVRIVVG